MNIKEQFLTRTDETGRFIVISSKTGIAYHVEVMDEGEKQKWGDLNPATKQITGSYGEKYRGSIKKSESLITPENGFKNITTLPQGTSPYGYISEIDEIRYAEGFRAKN